ncbi:hypothetical protein PAHAL_2G245800 [Panicum hallii]|jgi:hypothetical protein|uniref:Uncharacterized protein n=1 Tax=Panicum hallii TaxID=206008 RepID=A0A2S3GZD6_9POAL|nr:uncharacterized protein LOC112882777 [Panicum hallii]PAN12137.1 hypothetical protein PAHAL_2G245800 [Panicum hallii]
MKKAVAVGGGGKGGTAPTDLLVCFPARQHLALMPKPICSPSRTTMDKAAAARRRQLQLPGASAAAGGGKARGSSPMFRGSKAKQRAEDEEEPQSPKVTCVGQIKVGRPKKVKPGSAAATKHGKDGARSWLTVVEEIERLHGRRKKVGWLETLGIRRDALPFLGGALRGLRHKARCFGSLHGAAVDSTTDSDEDDGDAEERGGEHSGASGSAAASVFSKWLMVLEGGQEPLEQDCGGDEEERDEEDDDEGQQPQSEETDESANAPSAPPPNALLLMRCRSAPAKGLSMSRRGTSGLLPGDVEQEKETADAALGDGETEEGEEELVFMSTAPGFLKLSLDIAKETWIVGGMDPLARSRSWKR